jgi:hypothetical protein
MLDEVPATFDSNPRRVVRLPDGQKQLVLIRRNIAAKRDPWALPGRDRSWENDWLSRLLRRDRKWRVEYYSNVDEDPLGVPREDARHYWVAADKAAAAKVADRVVALLTRGGYPELLHDAELPATRDRAHT